MKRVPRISDAEWEVMEVVWTNGPCPAGDIVNSLSQTDPIWHPKTIKTFLARLVRKRALAFRQQGRAYVYRALVKREDCIDAATQSFLERAFGGSLKPRLAHFVERQKLSAAEIEELKRLLEAGEEER